MIIRVYQSGGIAGDQQIPLGQLDTALLPTADQARVEELTNVIENPPEGTVPIGADLVEYHIEIRAPGRQERSIVVPDDMNPNNPLLQSVQQLLSIIGGRS